LNLSLTMLKRVLIIALLAALTALPSACGVKSSPKPTRSLLPARISAPKYSFNETGRLVITFTAPDRNLLSKPLESLGGFFIDRAENKLEPGFCPNCPITFTERLRIEAREPDSQGRPWDGIYTYEDSLKPGYVYNYRLVAFDHKERYDRSEFRTLTVYYDSPSRPPDSVVVKTGDKLVHLTWSPPDRLTDGRELSELAGYDLFRRTGSTGVWIKLNADQPWKRALFEDRLVENGQTYYYKIRALRHWHGTWIQGAFTPEIEAVPVDLTPPPPPANLVAVSVPAGIRLNWSGVAAADVAGYRVYRRTETEIRFKRLTENPLPEASYLDREVSTGCRYIYHVTVVDTSPVGNESEPTQDVEVLREP